jgi:hypothetical protein
MIQSSNTVNIICNNYFSHYLSLQADFVTVDDRLLKQCRRVQATVWYGTPLTYCEKENLR